MSEPVEQPSEAHQTIAALVGTLLGERYRLERVLGAGGMGAVFEGRDVRLGRPVAVKVMQPGYAKDAEYVKRFLREAQAASLIRHRNVVVILDYGEAAGGIVYSVMERLVGRDLEEHLREQPGQRVPWSQACELLLQIASGLRAAHGQGVIHRDVKPANCFLTMEDDEPVVKVVDFGIAKLGEGMQTQQLTGTGNVLGTPSYTAPEMVLTGGPASPRSDVYSLGVVAYRMLTGRLPFTGNTAFEVMHHACILPVPRMRQAGVEVPEAMEALVLEMLAKTPDKRPPDMGAVRQRLAALRRDAGEVEAPVKAVGSISLPTEVGGAGASGSGDVTRTEMLDSGQRRELSDPTAVVVVDSDAPVVDGPAVAVERTEVITSARGGESSRHRLVTVAPVERTEVVDSRAVERPQGKAGLMSVVGGVIVAAVLGGVAWVMTTGERAVESVPRESGGSEVAMIKPETPTQVQPQLDAKLVDTQAMKLATPLPAAVVEGGEPSESVADGGEGPKDGVDESMDDAAGGASVVVDPKVATPSKPTGNATKQSSPKAAGPPSDAELKKKLARKIKGKCATEMAGKGVTVVFDVSTSGNVKRLTAMPKGVAGDCAKRQIEGTRFRPRDSETNIEIEVG